jgi:hypothetical protein
MISDSETFMLGHSPFTSLQRRICDLRTLIALPLLAWKNTTLTQMTCLILSDRPIQSVGYLFDFNVSNITKRREIAIAQCHPVQIRVYSTLVTYFYAGGRNIYVKILHEAEIETLFDSLLTTYDLAIRWTAVHTVPLLLIFRKRHEFTAPKKAIPRS